MIAKQKSGAKHCFVADRYFSMRESDFEAPLVLGRNKEPARASFFAFESRDAALRARKESSTRFVSLNKRSSPLL